MVAYLGSPRLRVNYIGPMPWRLHHKIYKLLNYHIYLNKHVVSSQQPYHGRSQSYLSRIQLLTTGMGIALSYITSS
jgi:hypothetical protein